MNFIFTLPRVLPSGIALVAALAFTCTAAPAPAFAQQTVSAADVQEISTEGATLKIQQDVDSRGTLRISGSGWTAESGGSTVRIKLNYEANGLPQQYTRTGGEINTHPTSGAPDATLWEVFQADQDGDFEITTDLPELTAGQKLIVDLSSGLVAGDVQRTIISKPLTVGGVAYREAAGEDVECVASTPRPAATVAAEPDSSGRLRITGTGWCNSLSGGALIGIKIDEGSLSRADDTVHANRTIFAIVQADDATGDWTYDLQLPDGTTGPSGSVPAFTSGEHTIRLLSGSLQENDPVATLPGRGESFKFVVGDYEPNGFPDPLQYSEDLKNANKNGIKIREKSGGLEVTVPGTKEGDWVYLNAYNPAGTPVLPWQGTWFQVNGEGKFNASLKGINLAAAEYKMVVQSGNQDSRNELLGWAWYEVEGSGTDDGTTDDGTSETVTSELMGIVSELESAVVAMEQLDTDISNYRTGRNPQSASEDGTEDDSLIVADFPLEETLLTTAMDSTSGGAGFSVAAPGVASFPVATGGGSVTPNAPVVAVTTSDAEDSVVAGVESKPAPDFDPAAPVPDIAGLNQDNAGEVTGSLEGELLSMELSGVAAGDWVYLHVYAPNVVPVGWVQVDENNTVRLDTSTIPNGVHKVAVLGEDGEILGWVEITLGADQLELADVPVLTEASNRQNVVTTASAVGATDWWMILVGALIPVFYALSLWAAHRSPRS
ncbi:hypothetical protein COCCU_12030 [Corynebacterium occultum]|uniref:Uncharacterized protein n=1 Tax=Corynebacterium occultum TaxID=2675219 RepID=A0A6B8WBS4_9CORY|nr:hypothetical protein [Corynebacterium occultum]QGU08306.1 hypothetical protein COCCU_12030 [Corynebacterium occultum]